jgi:glycosyltransferase involved in cell wall biosynthesis
MHILLIHQAFAAVNEPGGTRHHEFARYLAKAGHQVSIIASPISYLTGQGSRNHSVEFDMDGNIAIYRAYTYPALHRSFFHRLFSFFSFMVSSFIVSLKIKNVDLVWGTSPPIFQSFTAWLVSKLKRVPFLLEIRDLWPAFAVAVGVLINKTLIKLSLWLEQFLYKRADKLIVNSPGFINHIENKGGKNITLIPNGADPFDYKNLNKNMTRELLGWAGKIIFLYAGAHGMSNDLSIILQAAKLLENNQEIKFVLLGDGKEKTNLINLADSFQLSNIQFLNPVPKNEIQEFFQASDVCIAILQPIDLYKTTYPNKVFDYMAAGKPILLAIDGVIRDVVESGQCGLYCQPGNPQAFADVVIQMVAQRNQLKEMGARGKTYLEQHFNRKKIAMQFTVLLEKMVNDG